MTEVEILRGVVVDEIALTLSELAHACHVGEDWVAERVEAGLISCCAGHESRFSSATLIRARRLVFLERQLEANPEVAALIADLIEEIHELRRHVADRPR